MLMVGCAIWLLIGTAVLLVAFTFDMLWLIPTSAALVAVFALVMHMRERRALQTGNAAWEGRTELMGGDASTVGGMYEIDHPLVPNEIREHGQRFKKAAATAECLGGGEWALFAADGELLDLIVLR
jgi:hypothetical protein